MDHRGKMVRHDRQLPGAEARAFLQRGHMAHVGTADAAGWPYVVPLLYVYEGGERLYLHTGDHRGHFLANIQENPRICLQVDEPGELQKGRPSPCDSALVYSSVIAFGNVRVYDAPDVREKKAWFLDCLLERMGDSRAAYQNPGYPMLDRIILYEVALEIVTGKRNEGLHH